MIPGNGLPIEPGLIGIPGEVGDHDVAGFGLPERVVKRPAKSLLRPDHRFGVKRLAYARQMAQAGEIMPPDDLCTFLHQ